MFKHRILSSWPLFQSRGLSIRGFGIRDEMFPVFIERPEGTGDYLFMLFHEAVQLGPMNARRAVPAGAMIIWDRAAGQFYGNFDNRWSHSWIHCEGAEIERNLRSAQVPVSRPLHLCDS